MTEPGPQGDRPGGVVVEIPSVLSDLVGGARRIEVTPVPANVGDLLAGLSGPYPVLARRLRDETGSLRRYVNVYVDGDDIRHLDGLGTPLRRGAVVHVLPSVAGG